MNSRSRRLAEFLTFLVCFLGSGSVRWKFVHGLFENAIYGGRVDNTFDAKVLQSYLLQYFEQAVFPGQVRWLPQNTFLEIKLVSRYYCALQSLRGQNGRLIAGFRKVPRWRIIRERLPLFSSAVYVDSMNFKKSFWALRLRCRRTTKSIQILSTPSLILKIKSFRKRGQDVALRVNEVFFFSKCKWLNCAAFSPAIFRKIHGYTDWNLW